MTGKNINPNTKHHYLFSILIFAYFLASSIIVMTSGYPEFDLAFTHNWQNTSFTEYWSCASEQSKQPSNLSLIKFYNWPCVCHGPPQLVSCTGVHRLWRSQPWWWLSHCQSPHCARSPPAALSPTASGSGPSLSGSGPRLNSYSLGSNFFYENYPFWESFWD